MRCRLCGREMWCRDIARCHARCGDGVPYVVAHIAAGTLLWGCRNCTWTHETSDDERPEHVCGKGTVAVTRLGDRLKAALEAVGFSEEVYREVKSSLGFAPTCHCDGRRQWLNRLDEKLQLGERLTAFKEAIGWR